MRDEELRDFAGFLSEFQKETDRGAALVGAALLDQRLRETLEAFLVPGGSTHVLLHGGNAPLGTFSARTKTCHALGLIDDHEYDECNLIRKVRNEFAHSTHGTTFGDAKIAALCRNLRSDLPGERRDFVDRPREMYVNAVILTGLRLHYRSEHVAREARKTRTWP